MEKTNVFQFMVVRAPNSVESKAAHRNYIKDDEATSQGRCDADLFSAESVSKIGPMIYKKVFCEDLPPDGSGRIDMTVPTAGDIIEAFLIGLIGG